MSKASSPQKEAIKRVIKEVYGGEYLQDNIIWKSKEITNLISVALKQAREEELDKQRVCYNCGKTITVRDCRLREEARKEYKEVGK